MTEEESNRCRKADVLLRRLRPEDTERLEIKTVPTEKGSENSDACKHSIANSAVQTTDAAENACADLVKGEAKLPVIWVGYTWPEERPTCVNSTLDRTGWVWI